ncbi:MAG: ABC transporter permease [Anaerolineales bacterium]|nr:ABC transporter permease [Anaerolineales bacterium]
MSSFLTVIKKEIGSVLRDGTIIIAVLIQLFIASFSSALLLGMLSLYDADTIMKFGGAGIKIGIVASDDTLGSMMSERGLKVFHYESLIQAEGALYQGKVTAIIVVPAAAGATSEIQLYLPNSEAFSSLIRMVIQEPLKQYENHLRAQNGIDVRYADLQGKPATSFEFVYSVLIPLLMFFPAFVAGSMTIDSLTEEVENNTLQTLLSAPLTINKIIAGKIAAAVIVAIVQCLTWLAMLQANGTVIKNLIWVILLALIVAGLAATLAALGAVFFKDRERSQFVYSLALLAMVSIGALLNLSPITAMSRLAIGDPYVSGWNVAVFAVFLAALWALLLKASRRLAV